MTTGGGLVRGDWVKPGAVVIDVGITRVAGADGRQRLVGDVAFDEIGHARAATPVPGGVGPMTIACLLANTARAAARSRLDSVAARRPDAHHGTEHPDVAGSRAVQEEV